jgi:hypothetical protein
VEQFPEEDDEEEEPEPDDTRAMRPADLLRSSVLSRSSHHRRSIELTDSVQTPSERQSDSTLSIHELTSLQEVMSIIAIMGLVTVKDRRFRLRVYKKCFVGSQLVDVMMEHECASSRKDAVQLALNINKRFRLFAHVVANHQLKDEVSDLC